MFSSTNYTIHVSRISLHDHFLEHCSSVCSWLVCWCIWCSICLFGFACYILIQCGMYFSTFLFLQYVITGLLNFCEAFSNKLKFHEKITKQIFLAMEYSITPHQEWSPIYMIVEVKNVNAKASNVLILLNVFRKIVAPNSKKFCNEEPRCQVSDSRLSISNSSPLKNQTSLSFMNQISENNSHTNIKNIMHKHPTSVSLICNTFCQKN